ncbi:MAG: type II toxin-antitoxin system prevent-host-death family antitoxin [Acidimicrobiales bacterium]|nr:type II toxin-antitoxin system prevent-host-death family antitoxin [Acidimicrobiales bacterium]
MTEMGIRALKQNASAVVAAAAAGEEVTITDRGRPVARLVPLAGGRLEMLLASGRARSAKRAWAQLPSPVRRRAGKAPLTQVLAAQRDAERF